MHWFFGFEWHAPHGHHRAGRLRRRLRVRRAGDGAELVAPPARRRRPPAPPPARRAARAPPSPRRRRASAPNAALPPAPPDAMDFDLQWLLLGLPVAFALGWLGSRFDLRQWQARAARRAQGLLQGPEPAAQRAAGQGHRRLHRGGAERPRHHRAALRARQPVPPPRRVRTRGARARAPAAARRPAARRPRARAARAGAGLHEGRPVRPRRSSLSGARRHGLRRPRRGWPCCSCTSVRATGAPPPTIARAAREAPAPARSRRASRTTGASSRSRPRRAATTGRGRCGAGAGARGRARRRARPLGCWPASAMRTRRRHRRGARGLERRCASAIRRPSRSSPPTTRASAMAAGASRRGARGAASACTRSSRRSTCCRRIDRARTPTPARARSVCRRTCSAQPTLSAAQRCWSCRRRAPTTTPAAHCARRVERAAKPLQRYRCAACGFEAQHYFWQCPGCLGWDSYPPQRAGGP